MMPSCAEIVFSKRSLKPIAILCFQKKETGVIKIQKRISWVVPLPRIPVTTRIIIFFKDRGSRTKPSFAWLVQPNGWVPFSQGVLSQKLHLCFQLLVEFARNLTRKQVERLLFHVVTFLNKNRWWMVFFSKWDGFTIWRNMRKAVFL